MRRAIRTTSVILLMATGGDAAVLKRLEPLHREAAAKLAAGPKK